ncbi:unnamed protein product [Rodentolepis nana]|uniref:Uncharacterized protein n=1 Tax=Rodentolepis nana TaxID=102285 RepID=A0A0R3TEB8_RODNA|nr:unnamed protein product [Rodentolepis nana]
MDGCSTFRRKKTGADSLMNGGGSMLGGGDALSLFDHNQSISGAPTILSASSSSSLGLLPINCDAASVSLTVNIACGIAVKGKRRKDAIELKTHMCYFIRYPSLSTEWESWSN